MEQALSDLRVLDLTEFIGGPYCTKLLAGFGAEVIKVEKVGDGDPTRSMGPFLHDEPHPEKSGLFCYLNTGKKSITLNLKNKLGIKIAKELVKKCDILVEDFSPGVMASLGLSYEVLKEINPKLIMTSISGFGQDGPYRDYKSINLIAFAMGGGLRGTGDRDKHPINQGGSQAEYSTGLVALQAVLGALAYRDTSGTGQYVDLSSMQAVATQGGTGAAYAYTGSDPIRGTQHFTTGHPHSYFPCKDGYVTVIAGMGGMPTLALLMGKPELKDHPLWADHRLRMEKADEWDREFLLPWLKEQEKKKVVKEAQELRMPFSVVQSVADLLEDPQLKDREFFVEANHPVMGKVTYPGAPVKLSETPWHSERAPLLGEHNQEIYCQRLSYSQNDLVRLRQLNVI